MKFAEPHRKVAIVIVAHNALRYCARLLRSLQITRGVEYEVVVVDNRSRPAARLLLFAFSAMGRINRLCLLDRNTFFAEANNVGVAAAARDCDLVLLLNSDTEARHPDWLAQLVSLHARGVTAYGVAGGGFDRADGYCFLVDRDLYESYGLDENLQWWWAITRLQAQILSKGHIVRAIRNHDEWLVHFGGKSGGAWKSATGMSLDPVEAASWFNGREIVISDSVDG
jgi:glycosyltransferase involved in cell wall biosynthesis